jgi:hypothetical protein
MQRTVERQRMIDEALGRGRYAADGHDFSLARLLGGARAWLAGQRTSGTVAVGHSLPDPADLPLMVAYEQGGTPRPQPVPSSAFYSGMVVVARGKQARSLEVPSGTRER